MAELKENTKEILQVALLVDKHLTNVAKVDKMIKEMAKTKSEIKFWDVYNQSSTASKGVSDKATEQSSTSVLIEKLKKAYNLSTDDAKLFVPTSLLTERKLEVILNRVGRIEINGETERAALLLASNKSKSSNEAKSNNSMVEIALESLQASEKITATIAGSSKITQEQLAALASGSDKVIELINSSTETKDAILASIANNRTVTEMLQLVKDNPVVYSTLFDSNGMPLIKPQLSDSIDDYVKANYEKLATNTTAFLEVTANVLANFDVAIPDTADSTKVITKRITDMTDTERLQAVLKHELLTLLLVDKKSKEFKKDLKLDGYVNAGYDATMIKNIKLIYSGGNNEA